MMNWKVCEMTVLFSVKRDLDPPPPRLYPSTYDLPVTSPDALTRLIRARPLNYNLRQFCWEGCHILPCFCFPPLPPFQCWISTDFSSAVLSGKHSTLKQGGGGTGE